MAIDSVEIADRKGELVLFGEKIYLRQVHPNFVTNGKFTSVAFRPFPSDGGMLSTYNGEMISAQNSHSHYTKDLGNESCGVVGIDPDSCTRHGLTPIEDGDPYPEHVSISFNDLPSQKEIEKTAKILKRETNGEWLYRV